MSRRNHSLTTLLALLGLSLVSLSARAQAPAATDWPQWRGPDRTDISRETGFLKSWPDGGPKLLWKATGVGGGYSTPSVARGRVFGMGYVGDEETVWARDIATGNPVWNASLGSRTPNVGYNEGPRSTPSVDGNRVYALGIGGKFVCLDFATGRLLWQRDLVREFGGRVPGWGYTESPLVDGEKVIVTPGGREATLVALNKETGQEIWRATTPEGDGAHYASSIRAEIEGVPQYVQFLSRGVVGISAADGKFLWRYSSPANGTANCSTPLYQDGHVFAASAYNTGGGLAKIKRDGEVFSAQEAYFTRGMQNHHGGMVLLNGHIYGFDGGNLTCMDFKTGEVRWFDRSVGKGSVTYADGHLYARGERGGVALIEATPEKYVVKGQFGQPDRSGAAAWAHPVISGGRLYLRDQDVLLCYDIKGESTAACAAQELPAAAEWAEFRGPGRTAISAEKGLLKQWPADGPKLLWKVEGLGGGYSTPSFSGGRIFGMGYVDENEVVWARELATGKLLWQTPPLAPANRQIGYSDGSRCTPTVDGQYLYALSVGGDFVCLEAATGRQVWRKHLVRDFGGAVPNWGYCESPLVDGEHVIVTPGGGAATLVALNKQTGAEVWRSAIPGGNAAAYASAIVADIDGVRQYIQYLTGGPVGVAATNGGLLWRHARPANGIVITTPVYRDHHLFVTTAYDKGGALLKITGQGGQFGVEEVYFNQQMQNHHGGVLLLGDHLYYSEGHRGPVSFVCRELKTGKLVWSTEEKLKGSVFFADGRMVVRSERGAVVLVEPTPTGFVEKGRFEQPDRTGKNAWAHPVVVGGRLYLRDQDALLCYDVKEQ